MTDALTPSKSAGTLATSCSAGVVTLRVPAEAWAILEETLSMDARSTAFDLALRAQIAAAMRQVEEVHLIRTVVPLVTTDDLSAAVDDLLNERLLDQDGRPYSRSQVEYALAGWLGQLSEMLFDNLATYARDGFQRTAMELPPTSDRDLDDEARRELADRECEQAHERALA